MKNFLVNAFFLLVCINAAIAQPGKAFTIIGSINTDTGKMILLTSAGLDFYPDKIERSVALKDGKFSISAFIHYPSAFRLGLKKNGEWVFLSGPVLIAPGKQNVTLEMDSIRVIPNSDNRYNSEQHLFAHALDTTKLRKLSFTHHYIKQHPDSYVAAWKLADYVTNYYDPLMDSCFNAFALTLQHSAFGQVLKEKIRIARQTNVGASFPVLKPVNEQNVPVVLSFKKATKKYYLVDFWFSSCNPCAQQFPALRASYEKFNNAGFEIIGISVDQEAKIDAWKTAIDKHQLRWPQYRDKNLTITRKLNILFYPTNFLVDENDVIIAKDISPADLAKLLEEKLAGK